MTTVSIEEYRFFWETGVGIYCNGSMVVSVRPPCSECRSFLSGVVPDKETQIQGTPYTDSSFLGIDTRPPGPVSCLLYRFPSRPRPLPGLIISERTSSRIYFNHRRSNGHTSWSILLVHGPLSLRLVLLPVL